MHSKGEATFSNTNYNVKIDSDEHLLNYKTTDKEYPTQSDYSYSTNSYPPIEEIDFVFMLTIKDQLNAVWDYDPNNENSGGFFEGSTGLTFPNEVEKMFKKINGYSGVTNDTNLATSKWNSASELKHLLNSGQKIAILIEGSAFRNNKKASFSVPTHWVGLLDMVDNPTTKEITIKIYTWSKENVKWTISYDVFKDSYYGYVAGK